MWAGIEKQTAKTAKTSKEHPGFFDAFAVEF
jgi:hypothetical protein